MIPSDPIQAETEPEDVDAQIKSESAEPQVETREDDAESAEDEAWLNACRQELEDDGQYGASDDDENLAFPQSSDDGTALTKTGDDVMSKFGHAIGALAESDEDFDDQALDYAAEIAEPSPARDDAVAPHIAAAERELERNKNSGPTDIFDRIAQAAESQFNESRGNTAKRVSELVDDRRVGTKRWTPSKTMKQRMEKLEAARAAAAGTPEPSSTSGSAAASTATAGVAAAAGAAAAVAASAPSSSTATMVTPGDKRTAEEDRAEAQVKTATVSEDTQDTVARQQQPEPETNTTVGTETTESDAASADLNDESSDDLRVIPGARGRRRDRARKSRLDEDFEKIFDDEGKPSINSLRRKLRSTASAEAEAAAGDASSNEAATGSASEGEPKKGLFSRLLQPKAKKSTELDAAALDSEDTLVAAFETNEPEADADSNPNLVIDPSVDENWETSLDEERKQNRLAIPIIGLGAAIALAGIGFFAYKFLVG